MKKILTLAVLFLSAGFYTAFAQQHQDNKNIVKVNVLSAIGKTASVEFERAIAGKFSLNGTFAIMPKSSLPFRSIFTKAIEESDIIDATKAGAVSVALEGRYYVNKKKVLEGVYVAPFVKYTNYNLNTNVEYNASSTKDFLPMSGHIKAVSAGLALGSQWVFANRLTVDWRIIGVSYGSSKGHLEGKQTLSDKDQKDIREQLDDLTDKLPIIKVKNEVHAEGVKSTIDGPWLGLRTGLSIGYSF